MDLHTYGTLVILQPSTFCNIDCSYCYLPERSLSKKMSLETLGSIYSRVFESDLIEDPISFCWHLGEPLAVPIKFYEEAFELARLINGKFNRTYSHSFQTNATLINADWIELIQNYNVEIGVSVDGPKFINDRVRVKRNGKGTHDETMRGVTALQNSDVELGTIMVLTDYSLDYPDEIFHFFYENNLYYLGFNIDEIEGIKKETTFSSYSLARYKSFLKRFIELNEEYGGVIKLREIWSNMKIVSGMEPHNTMNLPGKIISFNHKGEYSTFCPELLSAESSKYNNFIFGDVKPSLYSMFSNPTFQLVKSEIEEGLRFCEATCEYWSFCGGGAPSNKFFEHGTFSATETKTCKYHKKATVDVVLDYLEEKVAKVSQHD